MNTNTNTPKTKKDMAEMFRMSEKTMRSIERYGDNLNYIRSVIGDSSADEFEKVLESFSRNKKQGISRDQITALCNMPQEDIISIVERIIRYPQRAKQIINNSVPGIKTKVTVTLPSIVSEWLDYRAADDGISKSKYIETLLCCLYENEND
ncbi:MAG: hypothetical protein LUD12_16060 [Lachnospiraceae bacterium]|nr:hypothetical protein [Lachnospiraceae bacterium]